MLKTVIPLILPLLFLGTSSSSLASNKLSQSFRHESLKIPKRLKKLGHQNFGRFSLNHFMKQIKSRKVVPDDNLYERNNNDGRITARWYWKDGRLTIRLYPERWWHFKDQRSILGLHENLMASGYERDKEYWISVSMWFLTYHKTQEILKPKHKRMIAKLISILLEKQQQYAGGVVGVGGGGEIATIYAKMEDLKRRLRDYDRAKNDLDRQKAFSVIIYRLQSTLTMGYHR